LSERAIDVLVFADIVDGLATNPPEHVGAPLEGVLERTNVDWPLPDCRLTDVGTVKTVVAEQVTVAPDCVHVVLEVPLACAPTPVGSIDAKVPVTSAAITPAGVDRRPSRGETPTLICSLFTKLSINIGFP
jgi:hypothetical protein